MATEAMEDLMYEIRRVPTYVRTNGDQWSDFLDTLSEKYGVEPDTRPRLRFSVKFDDGAAR